MADGYSTKVRKTALSVPGHSVLTYNESNELTGNSSSPSSEILVGEQKLGSEGHRRNSKTGNYEGGGPFLMSRSTASGYYSDVSFTNYTGGYHHVYDGYVGVPYSYDIGRVQSHVSYQGSPDHDELNANGATAISLVAPTNPPSTLGVGLAEAHREGLPSLPGVKLWRDRASILKAAGSEYLNAVFGWLPLIGEVKDVSHAARHFSDLQRSYENGEGKDTRREFSFPISRSSDFVDFGSAYPYIPGYSFTDLYHKTPGHLTLSIEEESKAWFSGAFTYALPSDDNWRNMLGYGSEASRIFGVRLDPDILWELAPWSWAVDWFSNAGRVINNVSNFALAGLVMRYGYSMSEKRTTLTYTLSGQKASVLNKHGNLESINVSTPPLVIENVLKTREPANPFGFGISWNGLSTTQVLIAAALGITRL